MHEDGKNQHIFVLSNDRKGNATDKKQNGAARPDEREKQQIVLIIKKTTNMKKIISTCMFAAILALGTTTTLTSCTESQMEDFVESVNIVGTWNCTETIVSSSSPSDAMYHYNGQITFRADHSFYDSYGDTGTWSIRNKVITLVYDYGFVRDVQFFVQDGYTPQLMVLTTTICSRTGEACLYSVTLRNIRR